MAPINNDAVIEDVDHQDEIDNENKIFIDHDYLVELSTLEGASSQSRLSVDKMSPEEIKAFHDVVENTSLIPIFLHIRNSILKFWLISPKIQLTIDSVYERLEHPFNNDLIFISRIFLFLERYGYINFGVFKISEPISLQKPKKIVIIGAGISGLVAARQLRYFGFDVINLEARNRLGGRVWTYNSKAEVGAFVVTGVLGNPYRVLSRQLDLEMHLINQKCPLYYNNSIIDKSKDEVIENVFNNILEKTSIVIREKDLNDDCTQPLSLADGLNVILELNERKVRQDYLKFLKNQFCLEDTLAKNLKILNEVNESIEELYKKHKETLQNKVARNPKQEYAYRVNRYDLSRAIDYVNKLKHKITMLQKKIKENEEKICPTEYLGPIDRRILDWHFANLEFATGTSLKNLSLQNWDLDDEYQFEGPQMFVKDGQSRVIECLAEGDFEIKLNQVVQSITLTPTGAEIQTVNVEKFNNESANKNIQRKLTTTTYQCDAVLCTLPLGMLKNAVNNNQRTESNALSWVQFKPPLPEYKCQAINRLGFGNLNKVFLLFEKTFWDVNMHLFGNIAPSTEKRGELFLFTSVGKDPVLVAYIAGDAADDMEKLDDETIKERCLVLLKKMYGNISALKNYYVTRWKSDPWSQGSYSYVAKGATGNDFDILAEPVLHPSNNPADPLIPRLFFAGEHTIKHYPSTIHGAFLSGLREAAKIANQFS
ncbi:RING finger protein [Sarcoptes scabiei]|nr:RING finger protein [Sarcoptes scabiei]